MMRASTRGHPRGAAAQSDIDGRLHCDRAAEEMLRSFWNGVTDGAVLPVELRGLAEGAQTGPPGVRRALLIEQAGERLRVEATAVGEEARSDGLTQREREVAILVADGLRSREVADRLAIAPQTVKSHLKTIFDKLGVRNRVELSRRLRR